MVKTSTSKVWTIANFISSIETLTLEEVIYLTSGTKTVLDTSYIKKIPTRYLSLQKTTNLRNIIIPKGVLGESYKHMNSHESKYQTIREIVGHNGTGIVTLQQTIDQSVVNLAQANDGACFTSDYGVVAYATCSSVISFYIIEENELRKSNGLRNFLEFFYRKNVGLEINKIKIMHNRPN